MPYDFDSQTRYRWLRITLGLVTTIAVILGLIIYMARALTSWVPPKFFPIPQAPNVMVALKEHPRLIADNRALIALQESSLSPEHALIMKKAEQFYAEYKIDPKKGDTIFPGYFALAYKISGDEKYLEAARRMVLKVAKFPQWNRRPESSNFYKIELAYAVGLAYDILYDKFSLKERKKIEEDLALVLDGILWHIQGKPSKTFWTDAPNSNYFVAWHSAAGLLAICLGDRYPRWQEAVNIAYSGVSKSLDIFKRDGGWIEGLTYQDFAWGQHGLFFLNALRVNDGPNKLSEEWFRTSVLFALAGILPSGTEQVNFGDNISDPIASFGYIWRSRAFFNSPFLDDFLSLYLPDPDYPLIPLDSILMEAILQHDPTLPLSEFPEPSPCQYFPGIEWVALRQDWIDKSGFYLAMKAGYGGWDHNHVDQGTMILAFGGRTFIADAGKGDFNARKKFEVNNFYGGPHGHNVFIPGTADGSCAWNDFSMYSDNSAYRQTDAKIIEFVDTFNSTSFTMILDGAYPSEGLTRWRRTVLWLKPGAELPGGAVLIIDDTDKPGKINLITPFKISTRKAGEYEREGISIINENAELGIWGFQPDTEIEYKALPESFGLNRLQIADKSGKGLSSVCTVLLPHDEIAHVVVEEDKEKEPFSIFVDGFLIEFRRDNDGNWKGK